MANIIQCSTCGEPIAKCYWTNEKIIRELRARVERLETVMRSTQIVIDQQLLPIEIANVIKGELKDCEENKEG